MRPWVASALAGILTFIACYTLLLQKGVQHHEPPLQHEAQTQASSSSSSTTGSTSGAADHTSGNSVDDAKLSALRQKLRPKALRGEDGKLVQHQFLHLHHMKTAGTSMDSLLKCAMKRLQTDMGYHDVAYMNIHECGERRYARCLSGEDKQCRERAAAASIMSYCAPLKDLEVFEWKAADQQNPLHALTVLRHPVARVWSMYRFRTKDCYQCRTLKEVYGAMDAGTTTDFADGMCAAQLQNHQTRNLVLQQQRQQPEGASEKELVAQAIDNLENFFTIIGLTEEIASTAQITGRVFPWMAEHVNGTTSDCPFPHANSSPKNNHCGPHGGHLELPVSPDEETEALIRQHNQMDIQVYDAAVKHFQLQKKALGL